MCRAVWLPRLLTATLSALSLACSPEPAPIEFSGVYSVQLHVHGSFSEGIGSIDSHSHEASELGVDVIWWSDHDFRVASHRHVTRFGFEAWKEPIDRNESWKVRPDRYRSEKTKGLSPIVQELADVSADFVAGSGSDSGGNRALQIIARGESEPFRSYLYSFEADRAVGRRPLASEVSIELAILVDEWGPNARPVIEIGLSAHPPRQGLPFEPYTLRYFLAEPGSESYRRGTTFFVPVPVRGDGWNDYRLEITRDAVRGFPFLDGEDNSLHSIAIGVEVRRGARVAARFDDLRIEQDRSGNAAFAYQRVVIDRVASTYPGLQQLQGVEISHAGPHLNEFSPEPLLLDFDALLEDSDRTFGAATISDPRSFSRFVASRAVDGAHGRGGIVSYNHPFGVGFGDRGTRRKRQDVLAKLVASQLYGADLLEVGYRARGGNDLTDHLWLWDQLAIEGLKKVGIGVSDSHGGPAQRWRDAPNNFVTWIHSSSPSRADLLDGLRAGRAFFGDISQFDGRLDLRTDSGGRMGDTVAAVDAAEISIEIEGLHSGDSIQVVETGVPTICYTADGSSFHRRHALELSRGHDGFLRVEVYGADGVAKVFSNPIYFDASAPSSDSAATAYSR